jgi:hypothetical protein
MQFGSWLKRTIKLLIHIVGVVNLLVYLTIFEYIVIQRASSLTVIVRA